MTDSGTAPEPLPRMTVELSTALTALSVRERGMMQTIWIMSGSLPPRISAVFDALCCEVDAIEGRERRADRAIIAAIMTGPPS